MGNNCTACKSCGGEQELEQINEEAGKSPRALEKLRKSSENAVLP